MGIGRQVCGEVLNIRVFKGGVVFLEERFERRERKITQEEMIRKAGIEGIVRQKSREGEIGRDFSRVVDEDVVLGGGER